MKTTLKQGIQRVSGARKGLEYIPGRRLNHLVFLAIFKLLGSGPEELLIDEGDSAIMVGSPNPEQVHRFASLTGAEGTVLFIEPHPDNAASLRTASSEYDYVTVIEKGVWSSKGTQELMLAHPNHPGDNKIPVNGIQHDNDYRKENYNESIEIDVDTLDNIVEENHIQPDFIEIAVNGAELEVLRGLTNTLEAYLPRLFVKGHPREEGTGKPINTRIVDLLHEHGYQAVIGAATEPTVGDSEEWTRRDGDVYGWR